MTTVLVNRLVVPTGVPDMTLSGSLGSSATSTTVSAVPSNLGTSGNVRMLIYAPGDANPEFIDMTSRSGTTLTIARQVEEVSAYPECAHASGAGLWIVQTVGTTMTASPYVHCQDQETSGTNGGTFTSGSWQTRVLNTKVTDTASIATLASNQITLAAGTYEIRASAPAFYVNAHQTRLQNVTASTTLIIGTTEYTNAALSSGVQTRSFLSGRFTVAAGQALELQHQCTTTDSTTGLGVAGSFGVEIYADLELWKVS